MKLIRDNTGRFDQRPYYEDGELEAECEAILCEFMRRKYGAITFPVPTDALTTLIEQDSHELNLYADLTDEGHSVHGVTNFDPGKKPTVCIETTLRDDPTEHRLRTTLTHEYIHVRFHSFLYDAKALNRDLFAETNEKQVHKCHRDNIIGAKKVDWMEWQAGFGSLALLMPVSHLREVVKDFQTRHDILGPFTIGTVPAGNLTRVVSKLYQVSWDAAHYWLLKQNYLSYQPSSPRLV